MPTSKIIALSDKVFRKLLGLYPASYRRDYGYLMAQLFRDQSRGAWQRGRYAGLLKLWLRTLPDLGKTALIEQLTQNERNPIMNAKHTPTVLLVAGLLFGLLSFTHIVAPFHGVFMLLLMASVLCNLAKAGVELSRPASEWPLILARTIVLMFVYALFLPAWAHMKREASISTPVAHDPFGLLIMICLFINPLVTAIKAGQSLAQRLRR